MSVPKRQVLVCVNNRPPGNPKGSCGEKGAAEIAGALKDLVRERGLSDEVMVTRTYCLKHCSRGVAVAVQPENVWYAGFTRDDVERLCSEHIEQGRPLDDRRMPDIPWE
jgi:(2Fe-2S) ferredoxin